MRISSRTALGTMALSIAIGCGIENSLVDGQCRDGYVPAGESCVPAHEGADAPLPPVAGPDTGTDGRADVGPITLPDGGDGGLTDAGDAGLTDAGDAGLTDAGDAGLTDAGDAGLTDAGDADAGIVDAGDAGIVDAGDAGIVDAGDAATDAPIVCTAPLIVCRGSCIPMDSDPANCGACGKICPSNICMAGECQGATPGDIVLIGHDYKDATLGSAPVKVLVNAFTIPTTDPIRILSFEDGAPADSVAQMKYLAAASVTNRSVTFTRASSASALTSATLGRDFDIVVVNDGNAVDPVATGASWATPLGTFAAKGGVIVAFDHGVFNMPLLLSSAGLLSVGSHTVLAMGTHLLVTGAGDVVGAQVLSPYSAFGTPVSFQGVPAPSSDFSWVVQVKTGGGAPGDPVVVHRLVR